jgi:hypothetical protein
MINMLNSQQTIAMDTLHLINRPCGFIEILSKSNGCFSSKSQLRDILRQLILLGEVKHMANSQYKISVASAKHIKTTPLALPKNASPKKTPLVKQPPSRFKPVTSTQVKQKVTATFVMPEPLLSEFTALDGQLNVAGIVVENLPLKFAALERLSLSVGVETAKLLLSIVQDLKKITGKNKVS